MQIHEITLRRRKVDEALGGLGSFMSGLTGGMSDKYMDKTPGGVKSGLTGFKANPDEYGPGAQKPSTKWQDKYTALQKDPAVISYVKNIAASWLKNPAAAGQATNGLAAGTTLQKTVPSLVTAAKKTNNNLTSTQIGQILSQSAPTIWNNTPDKSSAIKQLAAELTKQGVTVDGQAAPVDKTAPATTTDTGAVVPPAKIHTGGRVKGAPLSTTPGAEKKRADRAAKTAAKNAQPPVTTPPVTTTPTTKIPYGKEPDPGAISEPVFLSGKKLDPRKPNDAKVIKALQDQGKLHEAATIGPAADQYRTTFTKWADGQFATRVAETGTTVTMDAVRKAFPDLDTELKAALNKIVADRGTPQQAKDVEYYAELAVAGVQAVAQMQKNKVSTVDQQKNKQISNTIGSIKQSLTQAGVDPSRLSQVGGQQSVRPTGNPAADSLLKLSGFKI